MSEQGHEEPSREAPGDAFESSAPDQLPAKPAVSVLMLAYNHARYLSDAIEGVLLQRTEFPVELVIAEDCSRDETRKIAEEYRRRYPQLIRVLSSRTNVGMIPNFQRGLTACRGEFIAMCEGDDYWHHPDKISMQVSAMRADPSIGLMHSEYDYRVGGRVVRKMLRTQGIRAPQGDAFDELLRGYWLGTATIMYRAAALEAFAQSGLSEANYQFGDYSRALHTALSWKVGYSPLSLATYRYTPGSSMNSGPVSTLRLRKSVIQCRKDFMSLSGRELADLAEIERDEHRLLYGTAYLARDIGTFDEAATWRRSNDPEWVEDARHSLRRILMRHPMLHALVLLRAKVQWWVGVQRRTVPMTVQQQRELSRADAP